MGGYVDKQNTVDSSIGVSEINLDSQKNEHFKSEDVKELVQETLPQYDMAAVKDILLKGKTLKDSSLVFYGPDVLKKNKEEYDKLSKGEPVVWPSAFTTKVREEEGTKEVPDNWSSMTLHEKFLMAPCLPVLTSKDLEVLSSLKEKDYKYLMPYGVKNLKTLADNYDSKRSKSFGTKMVRGIQFGIGKMVKMGKYKTEEDRVVLESSAYIPVEIDVETRSEAIKFSVSLATRKTKDGFESLIDYHCEKNLIEAIKEILGPRYFFADGIKELSLKKIIEKLKEEGRYKKDKEKGFKKFSIILPYDSGGDAAINELLNTEGCVGARELLSKKRVMDRMEMLGKKTFQAVSDVYESLYKIAVVDRQVKLLGKKSKGSAVSVPVSKPITRQG